MNNFHRFHRHLGKEIYFGDRSVSGLLAHKKQILQQIDRHGCICLKSIDFKPKQMLDFTRGLWEEVILLPKCMTLNNLEEQYPQVARVGNVMYDGSLKDSSKQAIDWHQDGDFWGPEKNHIYNLLYSKILPSTGGDTHVMDLVGGASFLKQKYSKIYERLQNLVGEVNMDEIPVFKKYNVTNTLGIPSISYHPMLSDFDRYGYKNLMFGSAMRLLDKNTLKPVSDICISQIHKILEEQMGFYAHKWENGDLLIYDNIQVIHRATEIFTGKRLLYRTQGRYTKHC